MVAKNTIEVKFYFFQVHYAEDCIARLPEMLEKVRAMPVEKRITPIYMVPRFLSDDTWAESGNHAALFTSKRMKAIPSKIKGDGSRESLRLEEDEGLAEDVAMACDPTGSVVAIQQNRYAMSEGMIAGYLGRMLPQNLISFKPILTPDTMVRFGQARQLRKLHIKLAGKTDFKDLRDMGLGVAESAQIQAAMGAPVLELVWSAGREREGLPEKFFRVAKAFKSYSKDGNGDKIRSLDAVIRREINGKSETEFIDLLIDRIFCYADIPMNSEKELDKAALLQAAAWALMEKKDELEQYIQPPKP